MLTTQQRDTFLESLHEPHYMDKEHKGPILLYGDIGGQKIAFWASPNDSMDYGREIYQKCLDGFYGEIEDGPYDEVNILTETSDLSPEEASKSSVIEARKDLF